MSRFSIMDAAYLDVIYACALAHFGSGMMTRTHLHRGPLTPYHTFNILLKRATTLATFAGHSLRDGQRLAAASGGLATWFQQMLMETGIVDRVANVAPSRCSDRLFHFVIWDDPAEIQKGSKSCYYPVEMSDVIHAILSTKSRYAVVGLPCFLKAIRLAMRNSRRLRRSIKVLSGLVCGQTRSKLFAEYLCAIGGGDPSSMNSATFRVKDPQHSAQDYGFRFECAEGPVQRGTVFWSDGMGDVWSRGYFKPRACDYCDDVFAEVADVVFMDAWLDRYSSDWRGTNLVLIRTQEIWDLFRQAQGAGDVQLEQVAIEDVIASQQGALRMKRSGLAERLEMARLLSDESVPSKRVAPVPISWFRLCQLWLQQSITARSKRVFLQQRHQSSMDDFNRRMFPLLLLLKALNYLSVFAARAGLDL